MSEEKPKTVIPAGIKEKLYDTLRSKRAWAVLAVLFFLLALGTLVPAGKLPLLRHLVYAMGYSPEESLRMSLFEVLFSWNEHSKMLRAERPDPNETGVFNAAIRAADAARENQLKSALINMRSVNAALARQGRRADQISGAYYVPPGVEKEEQGAFVSLNDARAAALTDANAAKVAEVYFGADSAVTARDRRDGYNSVNALSKVKNTRIAGSAPTDWFSQFVDRASRQDADLGNLREGLEASGLAAGLGQLGKIGKDKPHQDLYWAWLTGKMARRTPQVILKKTLAAIGFNGAELPKTVFTATGFSGVNINPDEVNLDVASIQRYLQADENCREALKIGGKLSGEKIAEVRRKIEGLHSNFPTSCNDRENEAFDNDLAAIQAGCTQIRQAYTVVQGVCGGSVQGIEPCYTTGFAGLRRDFSQYCKDEEKKCTELPAEEQASCLADAQNKTLNDARKADKVDWDSGELKNVIDNTFLAEATEGEEARPLSSSYFPSLSWEGDAWAGRLEGIAD